VSRFLSGQNQSPSLEIINASGKITASNKVSDNSRVNYIAKDAIFLDPNHFSVANTAVFSAKVQPPVCP
jgi:hypothetical protein